MMNKSILHNERGSWSLIGLLVVVVIGLVLVLMFMGPQSKPDKDGAHTTVGRSMNMAKETECKSNLTQIRTAITMYRSEHEAAPASLADVQLGTSSPEFVKCPVGKEAYVYDAAAGTIHCPHAGHENF
jgi:competence protein ComGC